MNIVHFTSVHRRDDIRIRIKEVATLAGTFGPVTLLVQDGLGDAMEQEGQIIVRDVGAPGGRFLRAVRGGWRMWREIVGLRPTIAHLHDPELIPVGLLLKLSGIEVIYDAHENVPRQILSKEWLPRFLRWPIAKFMAVVEWFAGRTFDGIVTVTPAIARRFPASRTTLVQNYPLLDELRPPTSIAHSRREPLAAYVGGITAIRGAREMVEALACLPGSCPLRLALAGNFVPASLREKLSLLDGWRRVGELGWQERSQVAELLARARMGLLLYLAEPNHVDAQPNKLFEYMAAGLPVIASDFPLWRQIVDGAECGLLVDPLDPAAIAAAMEWLFLHPAEAEAMGERGRQAVWDKYNWDREAPKLMSAYRRLLSTEMLSHRHKGPRQA